MPTCDHCLLEFPAREAVYDPDGTGKAFCCRGCLGIYRLIRGEGLSRFYERRTWDRAGTFAPAGAAEPELSRFAGSVRNAGAGREVDLLIEGIRCASCIWLNEKALEKMDGVEQARVNYVTHRARVRWDPGRVGLEDILERIRSFGYRPLPWSASERSGRRRGETRDLLFRLGTAGFFSLQVMIASTALYAGYFQGMGGRTKLALQAICLLLTVPVLLYAGGPLMRNGLSGLGRLRFAMDSLVALGAGSAFVFSLYAMLTNGEVYFDTAVMIVTLVLMGRFLEATAKGKASEALERLEGLRPREARVVDDGGSRRKAPLESVRTGDRVEVIPGERIPLDGIVTSGASEADESLITGEAAPIPKREGDPVIGGSMNLHGSFVFEVTRTGEESVLSGILRVVEEAQAKRPNIQAAVDRVLGFFVPAVLALAGSAALFHLWRGAAGENALMIGISVLVIACPCSLGLATPLALLIFTSTASARGLLIRNGDLAERACRIDHVVFDKTGTLTRGRPVVREVVVLDPPLAAEEIIARAGAVEAFSEHSIGRAVAAAARELPLPSVPYAVSEFQAVPGRGVAGRIDGQQIVIGNAAMLEEHGIPSAGEALSAVARPFETDGDTVVCVGWAGALRAVIVVSDGVREESAAAVAELKGMGCRVSLVSGDQERTTRAAARRAGIEEAVAGISPIGKKDLIARMQQGGAKVMMVGDGVNDAPGLIQAQAGIAMGRGSDVAVESADAVLVRNDLALVPYAIRLSRQTFGIIRQNIFWALFYNLLVLPAAFCGLIHPIAAAGAMAASSLMVVGNSCRIGKTPLLSPRRMPRAGRQRPWASKG